jgi:hypothetical protein
MKRNLLILRIAETVLLLVVVYAARGVETRPTGEVVYHYAPFNLLVGPAFHWFYNPSASYFVVSSITLGYLVSVIGTLLQRGKPNRALCLSSLVLAGVGLLSFANEFIRYHASYGLELIVSLPALVLVIDWAMWGLLATEQREETLCASSSSGRTSP